MIDKQKSNLHARMQRGASVRHHDPCTPLLQRWILFQTKHGHEKQKIF